MPTELDQIRERYERRASLAQNVYSPTQPDVLATNQEKTRGLVRLLSNAGRASLADQSILEIGCGSGSNLQNLILMGAEPSRLVGIELLPDRCKRARETLPQAVTIICGDAATTDLGPGAFDIVLQSTVFSSVLDTTFRQQLAARMWSVCRVGGGVLWYDFVYNNPRNPDVRGVALREIRSLFPAGRITTRRVTLAPPLARFVCRLHPRLYSILNLTPILRTHLLCWIAKVPTGE